VDNVDGKQNCLAKILIVDDEPAVRFFVSQCSPELGIPCAPLKTDSLRWMRFRTKSGYHSLRSQYAGMSGFELLSVVRRRYPSIRVIAMSGAFSGEEASSGVRCRCFLSKGVRPRFFVEDHKSLPDRTGFRRIILVRRRPSGFSRNRNDTAGEHYVTVLCSNCSQALR